MKSLIYFSFFLTNLPLFGQTLSHEQVKGDLIQLSKEIHTYNPALNLYAPHFKTNVSKLIEQLPADSIQLLDYFNSVSLLCALSNEGHFALGNWGDKVHAGFIDNKYRYIPISVKVLEGKMFVWIDNSAEQGLTRGDEILEINNQIMENIFSSFYKAIPSDGTISTYIDRNIELGFSWMYYFYIARPDTFRLKVKKAAGEIEIITIRALTRDVQFENYDKYYSKKVKPNNVKIDAFYYLEYHHDVAYLTLPTFDYSIIKKYGVNSKKFYKSIFADLQKRQIKYLVIDLRGNTGGRNEFADDMVAYINKGTNQTEFLKKTISWEGKTKSYKMPRPSKKGFKGAVYVLVDGRTYSAGSTLSRYLKEYANATVLGEETGTRYEGFVAGSTQYITLKNSQLKIGIPRYHLLFPESKKQNSNNTGLLPTYKIEYSITDLMNGTDLHLDKVNELIRIHKVNSK